MREKEKSSKNTEEQFCGFCGKSQQEVEKLIAGSSVFICSNCVVICAQIMLQESEDAADRIKQLPEIVISQNASNPNILRQITFPEHLFSAGLQIFVSCTHLFAIECSGLEASIFLRRDGFSVAFGVHSMSEEESLKIEDVLFEMGSDLLNSEKDTDSAINNVFENAIRIHSHKRNISSLEIESLKRAVGWVLQGEIDDIIELFQ